MNGQAFFEDFLSASGIANNFSLVGWKWNKRH